MPITPFIGVRISWLMLARNCDLATVAAWAFSVSPRSLELTSISAAVRSATRSSRRWPFLESCWPWTWASTWLKAPISTSISSSAWLGRARTE